MPQSASTASARSPNGRLGAFFRGAPFRWLKREAKGQAHDYILLGCFWGEGPSILGQTQMIDPEEPKKHFTSCCLPLGVDL